MTEIRRVEKGETFTPFNEGDFRDLDREGFTARFQLENVGEGKAIYERLDMSLWVSHIQIVTPHGEVISRYSAILGEELRERHPLNLMVGFEEEKNLGLACRIAYPEAGVGWRASMDEDGNFSIKEGDKILELYLPDKPRALADLHLTFESVEDTR